MAVGQRLGQKGVAGLDVGRDDTRHPPALGNRIRKDQIAIRERPVNQVLAVQVQDVEDERRQRQTRSQALDVQPASEATGAHLKQVRATVLFQRERLAVQHR